MSLRVLLSGAAADRRETFATWLDAALDVDIASVAGPFEALRWLANADPALVVILPTVESHEAPALDLLRFLSSHARHGHVPVIFCGGSETELTAGRSLGATLLPESPSPEELRAAARSVLGLG